ncbi:MAG: LOG family protein [Phycisphaerales bacterium]|nr:LOG family protein [Phycisphaerales bacterium]
MASETTPIEAQRADRDAAIREFASRHFSGPNEDMLSDMLTTLCRLARDEQDRADMKLMSKALAELRYGFKIFKPFRDSARKISIFGSSRTPETHPDYIAAVEFARRIREVGWMVITGAGDGIMKAGHGGAGREASFGVAIRLPFEQRTNDIIENDAKLVNFRYFFTRKVMFIREASAVALFPGGFGTQDEGFEALTLVQTGKAALVPIVMVERPGGTYWPHWKTYVERELLHTGMISPADMDLFQVTDNIDSAIDEVVSFFRVYHSMRYVGDDLVLRLNRPLSAQTVERLNDEYGRLIAGGGRIEMCETLPSENGEFADKPRLKLRFDRKNIGILRRMVDVINAEPEAH